MKKTKPKLTLSTQTLRVLDATQLPAVAGGGTETLVDPRLKPSEPFSRLCTITD